VPDQDLRSVTSPMEETMCNLRTGTYVTSPNAPRQLSVC